MQTTLQKNTQGKPQLSPNQDKPLQVCQKGHLWRKKESAPDPKHTASSLLKHAGGSVTAWACMSASGTGLQFFNNDVTHKSGSRMIYRNTISTNLQGNPSNVFGKNFIMQEDNKP